MRLLDELEGVWSVDASLVFSLFWFESDIDLLLSKLVGVVCVIFVSGII